MTQKQQEWLGEVREKIVAAFKTRIALNNPMIVGFMLGQCLTVAELEALYLFLETPENFNEFIYECMKDANAQCDKKLLFKLLQFLSLYSSRSKVTPLSRVYIGLRKLSWKLLYQRVP